MTAPAIAEAISMDAREDRPSLIAELVQYKDLLFMLTWRDITIRYKQAVMGFVWALLMPILIVGSGFIVMAGFSTMSGRSVNKADVLSVAVRSVPWAFVVAAIRFATNSLTTNKDLVTKIYFPRQILPLSAVLANVFDLSVAAVVLALFLGISGIGISTHLLWLPLLLMLLLMLTVAFAILLSSANLFFRDVKYLVEVGLTYGVFFTPVFYSSSSLGKWGPLLLINPYGPILESISRTVVLHQPPHTGWLLYSAVFTCAFFFLTWKLFRKIEPLFPESI